MVETGRARYVPHALVAATVFEFMHIADELAGNWAPFQPFNDPMVGMVGLGIFTLTAMGALWGVHANRQWGYGLAAVFGLFFAVVECWHYFDPSNMTTIRWTVLLLAQFSEVIVLVLGAIGLQTLRSEQ
jgi:hypothetical protein